MKRTGRLTRRVPLTRGAPLRKRNPKTGGKRFYKIRNVRFKKWAKSLGCHLANLGKPHCCRGRIEFAHVIPESRGAPDVANGVGLCFHAHQGASWSIHATSVAAFDKLFGISLADEARGLAERYPEEAR